jgi:hypothetical protein
MLDFVFTAEFFMLDRIIRHQGGELGILTGVSKRRQDGNLRDVPEADHGVSDFSSFTHGAAGLEEHL